MLQSLPFGRMKSLSPQAHGQSTTGMQTGVAVAPAALVDAGDLAARNALLRQRVQDDLAVWIVSERFDPSAATWTVDLVRERLGEGWQQRYKYDVETGTLYFWGEQPLSEDELEALGLRPEQRFWPLPLGHIQPVMGGEQPHGPESVLTKRRAYTAGPGAYGCLAYD